MDKDELEKQEKRSFDHVTKIFQRVQKLPDKDDVHRRFLSVEDSVRISCKYFVYR